MSLQRRELVLRSVSVGAAHRIVSQRWSAVRLRQHQVHLLRRLVGLRDVSGIEAGTELGV
jgi:hypothetical protein